MKSLLKHILVLALAVFLIMMSGCIDRFVGEDTDLHTGDPITPEEIDSIFDAISASVTEKYPVETDFDGDLIVYWLEGGSVWHSSLMCGTITKASPESVRSGKISDAVESGKDRACRVCSEDYAEYTLCYESSDFLPESETETVPTEYIETTENGDDSAAIETTSPESTVYQDTTVSRETTAYHESTFVHETTVLQIEETTVIEIKYPKEYDSNGSLIVYWLKSGSVWHESAKCATVQKASPSNLFSGTPNEAFCEGKERPCKVCSSDSDVVIEILETTAKDTTANITEPIAKYPKEYDLNGELIVYWLKSGSVWHESSQCGTVRKSSTTDVYSGTPYDAFRTGKERACKVCSSDSQVVIDIKDITTTRVDEVTTEAPEKYAREYDENGNLIVYWLESGTVWHESKYCSVLSDVAHDKILSGSVSNAMLAGKERACKRCSR